MTNTQPASPATSSRTRLGWVLGLTSTAYFMVVLDSSVVLTALPRMQRDLHAGLASLQWTVNAYGIAFAAGLITAAARSATGSGGAGSSTSACRCSPSPRPPAPSPPAPPS